MKKCYDCTHVEMCGWRKEVEEQGCEFFCDGIGWIPETIDTAPTVDAVPVVRCKDCKCWTEWSNGTGSCSRFALDWIGTDADDFCSMGERKEND